MPIPVDVFGKKAKAFEALHKDCPATWKEPEADQSKSIVEKANFWQQNGEHGSSSEAMWFCLMNIPSQKRNHPSDPDDFRRCYLLLKMVPEWHTSLYKLKKLSPEWERLVEKWDKLTEMLEELMKTHKDNGMYDLMQKCIDNK